MDSDSTESNPISKESSENPKLKDETLITKDIEDQISSETSSSERSLLHRMFGPMRDGSVRGAIFSVSSFALGTGCLTLPIRFCQMSLTAGIILLVLGAGLSLWTLILLVKSQEYAKKKGLGAFVYSRLVKNVLGKIPSIVLDLSILIYTFGVIISYQVIIFQTLGRVIFEVSPASFRAKYKDNYKIFEKDEWKTIKFKLPIMYGIIIVLIPLLLLKNMTKMRFTSMFAVFSLLFCIGVIVVESPFYYDHYKKNIRKPERKETHENFTDFSRAFGTDMLFFPCLAAIFFAFTCHTGAFPAYESLANRSVKRITKVYRRSIILDLFIYLAVSISGFFTAPYRTPDLIIYREPKDKKLDIAMCIAKIFICLNLMMSLPSNYNAFRVSFFEFFFHTDVIDNKKNIIVTLTTSLISATIGIVYQEILAYITILGGFLSVVMQFLIPILLYVAINGRGYKDPINVLFLVICFILCSIGFTAGLHTIIRPK